MYECTLPTATREAAHFDRAAIACGMSWWANGSPAGQYRAKRRALMFVDLLDSLHEPNVLEIGCGTGAYTKAILDLRPALRIVASDVSAESVALASRELHEHPNLVCETMDACSIHYPDNEFDVVTGYAIVHHMPILQCLQEVSRVLKPGGRILFFEPNLANPQLALYDALPRSLGMSWFNMSPDERYFGRWKARRCLNEAGFTDVSVRPFDFVHPRLPSRLIRLGIRVGLILEKIPLVKEIAGSLVMSGTKPA